MIQIQGRTFSQVRLLAPVFTKCHFCIRSSLLARLNMTLKPLFPVKRHPTPPNQSQALAFDTQRASGKLVVASSSVPSVKLPGHG
jgi:hypothetical protein